MSTSPFGESGFDEEHGCAKPGKNGRARHRGTPLTVDEIRQLPEGAKVVVTWAGGNGPWDYTIVHVNGEVCVSSLYSDPLLKFGRDQERPLNRVTRA